MAKLFNNIRKQLVADKPSTARTTNYLKYAIGEIVLVMIGILLALQVNIWNEKRKSNRALEGLIDVFENDLEKNISKATAHINRAYFIDSVYQLYREKKITEEMIIKNPYIAYRTFTTSTIQFLEDNLNELLALEKDFPKKYKSITDDLKKIKRQILSQKKWEKLVIETSLEQTKYLDYNFSWYRESDSLSLNKMIHYFAKDPLIRNRILNYREVFLEENSWDVTIIRSYSLTLLWKINAIRGTQNDKMSSFFENHKLAANNEVLCNDNFKSTATNVNFGNQFIFYNNYNKEVTLQRTRNGKNRGKIVVDPQSFISWEFRLDSNNIINLIKNDTCIKKISVIQNGYTIAKTHSNGKTL